MISIPTLVAFLFTLFTLFFYTNYLDDILSPLQTHPRTSSLPYLSNIHSLLFSPQFLTPRKEKEKGKKAIQDRKQTLHTKKHTHKKYGVNIVFFTCYWPWVLHLSVADIPSDMSLGGEN